MFVMENLKMATFFRFKPSPSCTKFYNKIQYAKMQVRLIIAYISKLSHWISINITKVKRYKSPGIDQIPAELIKSGGRTICSEIHTFINSIWNKQQLPEEWNKSIIVPIYKKGNKTDCSNYQLHTKFYQTFCHQT